MENEKILVKKLKEKNENAFDAIYEKYYKLIYYIIFKEVKIMEEGMAQRIKALRQEKGLTLEQVAKVVGVGKSTVRKWETGMIANMRRDKIAALAKALGTTPAYLMGWKEDETNPTSAPITTFIASPSGSTYLTGLFPA